VIVGGWKVEKVQNEDVDMEQHSIHTVPREIEQCKNTAHGGPDDGDVVLTGNGLLRIHFSRCPAIYLL
jgi:hypothetical protein